MSNFIVEFPLQTEKWQEDILVKRFKIGKNIYNAVLHIASNRISEMIKTKIYRNLKNDIQRDKNGVALKNDHNAEIFNQLNILRDNYKLSKNHLEKEVKYFQRYYKKNIGSHEAQKISLRVWRACEYFLFKDGEELHFKNNYTFNSINGKSNKSGIRFRNNKIYWLKLSLPVMIDFNNDYEIECLKYEISYCTIVQKFIRGKYKYYVQITFKGKLPLKRNKSNNKNKRVLGVGDVGLDIGTSTIAYSSENILKIVELADRTGKTSKDIKLIERKIDRSKRITNPQNYNKNGTIIKGSRFKYSNKCKKLLNMKRELHRKDKAIRYYQHNCLANEIISLGDKFYVETMNFKALQKRKKKTEKNEKGKFKRKKRFGKSLGNRAPATLLTLIDNKLKSLNNKGLIKVNTIKARASQFNHTDQTYKKKSLSKRWNNIEGYKIQRDLYSAFLIMNISTDLETFDLIKCNNRFDKFLKLHEIEIQRLLKNKNLSSIGV